MELKSYLKIVRKERKMILTFAAVTALSAWIFSISMPAKYETSVSLLLKKEGSQPTDEFKYNGYYALESGKIIADNIEKLLQSPLVVDEIYRNSAVDPAFKNIKGYKKKFTAHKMSNMYVEVSFEAESREDAEKISRALTETVGRKVEETKKESEEEIAFSIDNSQPIIIESRPDARVNTLAGLISGLLLGTLAAFLKKYFA